jgi:SAM-dependent methyltransferase
MADRWASAEAYEGYVGRWSSPVAEQFLRWIDAPREARWVDVGCGTGVLTAAILRDAVPTRVVGVDPSEPFLAYARTAVTDDRVEFRTGVAEALPIEDGSADVVVSGLVLSFVPDPSGAIGAARRALRPDGIVAAYVWDYAEGMELMKHFWSAAAELDASVRGVDEGLRFPLCQPGPLRALFSGAGLERVEGTAITVPTVFRDFDDYWSPFLAGTGPAPAYASSLDASHRAELRESLRGRLPTGADGSIALSARAWAVSGRVPATG